MLDNEILKRVHSMRDRVAASSARNTQMTDEQKARLNFESGMIFFWNLASENGWMAEGHQFDADQFKRDYARSK